MTIARTILVPTDFSEHADQALAYAVDLATQLGATVHLVHAISVPAVGIPELGVAYSSVTMENAVDAAQKELEARAARLRDRVSLGPVRVEVGDARDVIDRAAETLSADLIVMGTHGRRGLRRMLLGSVAEAVVRSAPCPVLTVRTKKS